MLGNIARMINLINLSGRKSDLIAVRAVACRSRRDEFSLRKLSCKRFAYRGQWIACSGKTHCAVYIGAARQRVADCAADTGCCAAERLNFRRVIVRFVFKEQQPVLFFTIVLNFDFDRAGVDFIGFVEFGKLALCFQVFCGNRTDVHKAYRLRASEFFTDSKVALIGFLQHLVFENNMVDCRIECRMSAMIRPVGVNHPDFRNRRLAVFRAEVLPAFQKIRRVHCKSARFDKFRKFSFRKIGEAFNGFHLLRDFIFRLQRLRQRHFRFPCFYRVNHIFFNR